MNILNNKKILKKPSWIRVKLKTDSTKIQDLKKTIKKNNLNSICEESACPNISECFNHGTAAFMILGNICTRRCPFCNVSNGRPIKPDKNEPKNLANTILKMKLNHVVITSVDRDDLHDGGAQQFVNCIKEIRYKDPTICIEILVPDFRNCIDNALNIINTFPPDIFNHNIESVPRLYKNIKPGANYYLSLKLLKKFKYYNFNLPTKSGLMVGLGETENEIIEVMKDLRSNGVTMLTVGQYLRPSKNHIPVESYVEPIKFNNLKKQAFNMGFTHVACGPFVRSSYYADLQAKGIEIK